MEFSRFMVQVFRVSALVRAKRFLAKAGGAFLTEMEDGRWKLGNLQSPISDLRSAKSLLSPAQSLSAALALCATLALPAATGWGQISISNTSPITENFDGLGTSTSASLPSNWKMSAAGAGSSAGWSTATNLTAVNAAASSGTPTAGARYNWGNGTTTTDRAVGFMTSGGYATPNSIMAYYVNNTGQTITALAISFDIERYRINSTASSVTFFTSTDGSNWTSVTSGDSGALSTGSSSYTFSGGTVVTKSFSVSGLTIANGGGVYLRWVFSTASSNSQGLGLDNVSLTATTGATAPTLTTPTVSSIGTTSATLGANVTADGDASITSRGTVWGTSANPTGNSLAEGGTSTGTFTHSRTGLTANTLYYYRGYAVNSAGTGYSAGGTFTTLPLAPTVGTGSSATTSGFTANWSHPTMGSASYTYTVEVDDDSNFGSVNATQSSISSANTSQAITGLSAATTYYFRVKAVNGQGSSDWSSTSAGIATLSAATPTIAAGSAGALSNYTGTASTSTSVSVTGTALTTSITATAPANFEVSADESTWNSTATLSSSGGTLYIRITSAASPGSPSGNVVLSSTGAADVNVAVSGTVYKIAPTAHVTNFAKGTVTTSAIPLTWTAASPAPDGYLIRVSSTTVTDPVHGSAVADDTSLSDGVAAYNVTSGATTSYSGFTGLVAGTTYTFKIFPYNNSGAQLRYKTDSTPSLTGMLVPAAPATPTFTSVSDTGFTVNWAAVANATSYRLDVSANSAFSSYVSGYQDLTVNTINQAVTGLNRDAIYYARVRAANDEGSGANSTAVSQITLPLSAPVTSSASSVSRTGFTANWGSVTGATSYAVDVYTGSYATDLVISEYVEGTSNNKYLEIYNGTGRTVSLFDYQLRTFSNGSATASNTQNLATLTGGPTTLAHGATLILQNSGAALALPAGVTAYNSGTINFTGDDALALYRVSTGAYVDVFGRIGDDPGTAWSNSSPSLSTENKTLRRASSVLAGITVSPTGAGSGAFTTLATEWTQAAATDDVSNLGSHTMDTTGVFLAGHENVSAGNNTSLAVTGLTQATSYRVRVRAVDSNSSSANSDTRVVATANPPVIASSGTLSALTSTYGSASAGSTSFTISGTDMDAGITVTPPSAFEVSTSSTFSSNVGNNSSPITVGTSGTISSTTIYVRLKAGPVPGSYSGNILLSSSLATDVNVATVSSTVGTKALTVTGLTGQNKGWDGTTAASATGTASLSGIVGSDEVTLTGTPTFAFANADVGTGKVISTTGYELGGAQASYYTVTQPPLSGDITAVVASAPSITGITEGNTELTVAFTAPTSNGGVSITNYKYSTDNGATYVSAGVTASPIIITNLANGTTYDVKIRAVNSAGDGTESAAVQGTPVAPSVPTVLASVETLTSALTTTYGTASSTTSFSVSGASLTGSVVVTAPSGLEVSTSSSGGFGGSVTLSPSSGNVASTTIYIRLAATAAVSGTYNSQSIAVNSDGASTVNVATAASGNTVSAKGLTINVTGLSATNKVYDGTTTVSVGGTATYAGLANGESHAVTNSVTWAFGDKTVANGKVLVRTGDFTAPNSNYTISSQPSLSANITPKELTVGNAAVTTRAYNGTTSATITGDLQGIVSGDTVTLNGTGTFASANAGSGISVTSTSTLGGADAGNYSLTQPTGLTGAINPAVNTITFGALANKNVGNAPFDLTATATSGQPVSFSSSDNSVATVAGSTVTILKAGKVTITATEAGNENYASASPVTQSFIITGAGSILLTGFNSINPDQFSFMAMHDLPGSFAITFTDNAWSGSALTTNEGNLVYTTPAGGLPAGSRVVIERSSSGNTASVLSGTGTVGVPGSSFALANGDNVFAYTGSSTSPNFLAGLLTSVALTTGTTTTTTTYIPAAISSATVQVVSLGTTANSHYTGATTGVASLLAAALLDRINWTNSSTALILGTGNFNYIESQVSQTITFGALEGKTYGDLPVVLLATASSGLSVSYASSDTTVATISGSTVTILKAGSTTITASQTGNPQYTAAAPVLQVLTVSAKSLTGSFTASNKTYDGTTVATVATRSVSGKVGSDDVNHTGGTATFSDSSVGTDKTVTLTGASLTGAAAGNYTLSSVANTTANITAVNLASGDITLTPGGDGSYTASAAGGAASFSYSYAGRTTNGLVTSYNNSSAPTAAGYYTVTATATGNYSGSKSQDYFVAGPVAGSDAVTKPADNSRIKIPTATLLSNDSRIHTDGSVLTDNLSITAVANGTGTAAISGAFVLFTPSVAGTDSFSYTVTDAITGKTATGTITVTTEAAPPSFDLQIVGQGTASYNGTQTSITMDFIGVPNQSYTVEYKGDLAEASWTRAGAQSTGSTGSFSVTFTKAGDHTTDWNGSMFFRASVTP